jgi:predicted TIM-barrel fold metal-dependent hydrolase
MKNSKIKTENNRTRRSFLKSAGLLIGSFTIAGAGQRSSFALAKNISPVKEELNTAQLDFFDIHLHGSLVRHPAVKGFTSPSGLIEIMNNSSTARAVVLPIVSPECMSTIVTPEEVLQVCSIDPDRLIPFCNLDPRFIGNSPDANLMPLLSAYKELGCKGLGEYTVNIPLDDPLNLNLFHQVEEIGFPLTFHLAPQVGGYYGCYEDQGLPRLEKVLKLFPKLIFLGHSQVFWAEIGPLYNPDERKGYPKGPVTREGRLVELMRKYPNLHGDLSAGSGFNAISRDPEFGYKFLEEFQDRLYYGTDHAKLPFVAYFRNLKEKQLISAAAYEKITWKNAEKLLLG